VSIPLIAGRLIVWFGHAFGPSRPMNQRGFHPLPWFAVTFPIGPIAWPLDNFIDGKADTSQLTESRSY
jgi:hypothetical protein